MPNQIPKKRVNQSKEEIEQRIKNLTKMRANVAFARDHFFPALCEAAESVKDAEMWLSGFTTQMMESFLRLMKDKTLKDLEMEKMIDPKHPKQVEWLKVINLFGDMNLVDVRQHAESMKGEIQKFSQEEMEKRKLDTLKVNWYVVPEK